jgi:Carboxypeptidase regulatory-like domain
MRTAQTALLAIGLAILLSGCSGSGSSATTNDVGQFKDKEVKISGTTGAIRGIVVDQAIVPIPKVAVNVGTPTGNKTAETDTQGRFVFSELPAGTYFLTFKHLLYRTVQQSIDVQAGVEPPISRVQMDALFTAKPYHDQVKFKGFIACGYNAATVTAPCVTDYTQVAQPCNGGCAPQLRSVQGDNRVLRTKVDANWQTIVLDMTFTPNGNGNTKEMGLLLRWGTGSASEWFGTTDGASPLQLRFETGVTHTSEAGSRQRQVNVSGESDLDILGSITADNGALGASVNQEFLVFHTNFYNAKPPEKWSFAKGDDFPF